MQQKLLESLLRVMPHALPVHWQLLDCAAILLNSSRSNAMLPWAFLPCICVEVTLICTALKALEHAVIFLPHRVFFTHGLERKELTDLVLCNALRALFDCGRWQCGFRTARPHSRIHLSSTRLRLRCLCVLDADEHLPDAMAVRAHTRLPTKTKAPAPTRKSADKPDKDSVDKLKDTWPTFQDQAIDAVLHRVRCSARANTRHHEVCTDSICYQHGSVCFSSNAIRPDMCT
eukprot:2912-Heterococcus_DN1.PRE.4